MSPSSLSNLTASVVVQTLLVPPVRNNNNSFSFREEKKQPEPLLEKLIGFEVIRLRS